MKFYRILFLVSALLTNQANAAPTGGDLSGANGTIKRVNTVVDGQTLTHTTITTNKNFQKINWTDFSSKAGEAIRFYQPNSKAVVFNKVTGNISSTLAGSLTANGRIVIMNPSGITFAAGSKTNVGSLYATTAKSISSGSEIYGTFRDATSKILNNGSISTKDGGTLSLFSTNITNNGTLNAPKGKININGVKDFELGFITGYDYLYGDYTNILDNPSSSLYGSSDAPILVQNSGVVSAKSGTINIRTVSTANNGISNVMNLDGVVDATRLAGSNGMIISESTISVDSRGDLNVGGTIVANAVEGTGGDIGLNANGNLHVKDTARIYANGGQIKGSMTSTSAGRIYVTKYGYSNSKPNDKLTIDGRIYARNGMENVIPSSPYIVANGTVAIQAYKDSYGTKTDVNIGSTAVINTKSIGTDNSNGGYVSIYGNKVKSSGTIIADGVGTGNGGGIEIKSAYRGGTVDISQSSIYSRGGLNGGNGGDLYAGNQYTSGESSPVYNANKIYLSAQHASGSNGKFYPCRTGCTAVPTK